MEPVRIPLAVRRWARLIGMLGALTLGSAALGAWVLAVVLVLRYEGVLVWVAAVVLFLVGMKLAPMALFAFRTWRTRDAAIVVEDGALVLDHPGIFIRPATLHRESVDRVMVVTGVRPAELDELGAFLLEGLRQALPSDIRSARDLLGWSGLRAALSAVREGISIPMLSPLPDLPNLAIRLRAPIELDGIWPGSPPRFRYSGLNPPARGERVRGLLAHVADARAAREAFAAWGVLAPEERERP